MESNRDLQVRRKPRIIIDKSFYGIDDFSIGDVGNIEVAGEVVEEKLDSYFQPDAEIVVKVIEIKKIDKVLAQGART